MAGVLNASSSLPPVVGVGFGITLGGVTGVGVMTGGTPAVAQGAAQGSAAQQSDFRWWCPRARILSIMLARWQPEAQVSQQGAVGAATTGGGGGTGTGAQAGAHAGAQQSPLDFEPCRAWRRSSRPARAWRPESQHGPGAGTPLQPATWPAGTTAPGAGVTSPPRVDDMSSNVAYTDSLLCCV
jgi:hypothetical protein